MQSEGMLDLASRQEGEAEQTRERFVGALVRLIHMARIHSEGNRLVSEAADEFVQLGERLLEDSSALAVESRHSRLFVQGEKMLFKGEGSSHIMTMLSYLDRLGVHGFEFKPQLSEVSRSEAYRFAREILEAVRGEAPMELLSERLDGEAYEWVSIIHGQRQEWSEVSSAERAQMVHQLYSYSYKAVEDISHKVQKGESAGLRKAIRVLQDITDLVYLDKSILMLSMTIRDYDNYTFTHSVNVAIHSVCLGHEIGFSRQSLLRLGVCGLVHDLGKVEVPNEILNKPGKLSDEEFKQIKRHALNSVRCLIRMEATSHLLAEMILPPFEHHLRYDLSGYPSVSWSRPQSTFGRIIQICDVYDALTTSRVYRKEALSPDRVLSMMIKESGQTFDPLFLKWFVNMHGTLPVGTVVRMDTGQLGLVSQTGDAEGNQFPQVLLLEEAGGEYRKGETIELPQFQEGGMPENIQSTHHPSEFGIQPFVYFLE